MWRLVVSFAALLAAATITAAPATAGRTATCPKAVYEQPFLPWLDPMNYVLAPNGTLEGGSASWTLRGGASVVSGNEPFFVHGKRESRSLSLPAGSSATTGQMCVNLLRPDLRFFAVNRGSLLSTLKVEVLVPGLLGGTTALPVAVPVLATSSWQPTLPLPFVANALAPLSPSGNMPVSFRFTPQGSSGAWAIDDVYLDPYKGR